MLPSVNWKRWTMPARLVTLSTILLCATSCASTGSSATTGDGAFCRIYQPVPASEGAGPAIDANEITYCAMCDPQCPPAIVDAWQANRMTGGE